MIFVTSPARNRELQCTTTFSKCPSAESSPRALVPLSSFYSLSLAQTHTLSLFPPPLFLLLLSQTHREPWNLSPPHRSRERKKEKEARERETGEREATGYQPSALHSPRAIEGPTWGHPMLVLGAVCSFLEQFCGHLSPKLDKVS